MFASLPPLRNIIDSQPATVEILSVDLGNSLVAPILHLHKTVALRATGVPVRSGNQTFNIWRLYRKRNSGLPQKWPEPHCRD